MPISRPPPAHCLSPAPAQHTALSLRLRDIANARAHHYQCKIAIGVQTATDAYSVGSNNVDAERDTFAWGSVTKLLTGAAVLRAAERAQLDLDAPVYPLVDPQLNALGIGPMSLLFGDDAKLITTRHLAGMKSGVPDYDTASPRGAHPTDAFRAMVYAQPCKEWGPAELLNVSWVATGQLDETPGGRYRYSSTNFVLLGLLLAQLSQAPRWDEYDQLTALDALPASRRRLYCARFAVHGAPVDWTTIHGLDRTNYNGGNASVLPGTDVYHVDGVFGGWTASDLVAPVSDTSRLAYDLFGSAGPRALKAPSVLAMVPTPEDHRYGLATFNLTRHWGATGASADGVDFNTAYGHLGATYGYQSIVLYFPGADVALSVATNLETDHQIQPTDVACLAYNAILASGRGVAEPICEYVSSNYYGGKCVCKEAQPPSLPPTASPPPSPPPSGDHDIKPAGSSGYYGVGLLIGVLALAGVLGVLYSCTYSLSHSLSQLYVRLA